MKNLIWLNIFWLIGSAAFGAWQHSIWAGLFMLSFIYITANNTKGINDECAEPLLPSQECV